MPWKITFPTIHVLLDVEKIESPPLTPISTALECFELIALGVRTAIHPVTRAIPPLVVSHMLELLPRVKKWTTHIVSVLFGSDNEDPAVLLPVLDEVLNALITRIFWDMIALVNIVFGDRVGYSYHGIFWVRKMLVKENLHITRTYGRCGLPPKDLLDQGGYIRQIFLVL